MLFFDYEGVVLPLFRRSNVLCHSEQSCIRMELRQTIQLSGWIGEAKQCHL